VQPETRYATAGDVFIAYQVVGDGPMDLVFVPSFANPIDLMWQQPAYARFLERLAGFSQLVLFDKRGSGRSAVGPDLEGATLEGWMEDIGIVMEAVGSERAALLGFDGGGPLAMLFASTYPERTSALVLLGTWARLVRAADHPFGLEPDGVPLFLDGFEQRWGTGANLARTAPSLAHDERIRRWYAQYERAGNMPRVARQVVRMFTDTDVRHVLPAVRVPTLVLHRSGDRLHEVEQGRYLAQHIPGARWVELPGDDHLPWAGDQDAIVGPLREFLTRVGPPAELDRVLATVMFTDIVSSTEKTAELGDRRWRELLDAHDALVRRELERYRGRKVHSIGLGDGVLATFDGPARAIRCACAIRDGVRSLGIEIRVGLHTGECELMKDDVGGIAVHIGARVVAGASPGEVLVSSTVKDLVAGSGLRFVDRGTHTLHGVPGEWRLFAVEG
jgi:pimeloyl-ACP methyl ester carboxylesterase